MTATTRLLIGEKLVHLGRSKEGQLVDSVLYEQICRFISWSILLEKDRLQPNTFR